MTKMAVTPFDPRTAIDKKNPWCKQTSWLYVYTTRVPIEALHCGNRFFYFFSPMTLTLTQWPSYTNLIGTPSKYTGCTKMNVLCQGFRKLSSDRQTDRETGPKLYTTPLCRWLTTNYGYTSSRNDRSPQELVPKMANNQSINQFILSHTDIIHRTM